MNIIHIMRKDLAVFFRDRGSIFYLLILPVVFILVFTSLVGATVKEQEAQAQPAAATAEENAVVITVVNHNPSGGLANELVRRIDAAVGYQVQQMSEEEALKLLNKAKIEWVLSIPVEFTALVTAGKPVELFLQFHPDANRGNLEGVQRLLSALARDFSQEQRILEGLKQMGAMAAANPETASVFNQERLIAQARKQFLRSQDQPLIAVVQKSPAASVETETEFNFLMAYVSGFAVLFVFLSAQVTARSFFDEKKAGSFRRLLAAPLRKPELLGGKLLPNFLLTCVQIVVIFTFGYFFLPLLGLGQVSFGEHPEAWAVVSIAIAICSTSMGIFIVGFARTETQVSGISTAILWVAGILSGSLVPTATMPDLMASLGRIFPHYYANQAYYDVLARGYGLPEVITPVLVLLGFSIAFFVIGTWKFDFE